MKPKRIVHEKPSDVTVADGCVQMDGPDAVDIALTPEAAEETSDRLLNAAVRAGGQRRLNRFLHRSDDSANER